MEARALRIAEQLLEAVALGEDLAGHRDGTELAVLAAHSCYAIAAASHPQVHNLYLT